MSPPHTFDADFAEAIAHFGLEEPDRQKFSDLWGRNQHLLAEPDGVQTLASLATTLRPSGPFCKTRCVCRNGRVCR